MGAGVVGKPMTILLGSLKQRQSPLSTLLQTKPENGSLVDYCPLISGLHELV